MSAIDYRAIHGRDRKSQKTENGHFYVLRNTCRSILMSIESTREVFQDNGSEMS